MANVYSYQTLEDTRKVIIKLTGSFDGSSDEYNPYRIKANSFFGALNTNGNYLINEGTAKNFYETTINRIWYTANTTGNIQLFWVGNTNATIVNINNNNEFNKDNNFVVINNNAELPTGDIGISTNGVIANSFYTIILELHKNNRDYDIGWMNDPGAYNYDYKYYIIIDENDNVIYTEINDILTINR